jgi:hypothetical protein
MARREARNEAVARIQAGDEVKTPQTSSVKEEVLFTIGAPLEVPSKSKALSRTLLHTPAPARLGVKMLQPAEQSFSGTPGTMDWPSDLRVTPTIRGTSFA